MGFSERLLAVDSWFQVGGTNFGGDGFRRGREANLSLRVSLMKR